MAPSSEQGDIGCELTGPDEPWRKPGCTVSDPDWPRSPWLITVSSETKGAVNVCVPVLA